MLARGYALTACDISPAMVAVAATKAPPGSDVVVADMRRLPALGVFDLVTCLDDAVNYLLEEDELTAALESMAGQLDEHGVLVFDVNTLATYRSTFAHDAEQRLGDLRFVWRGETDAALVPGGLAAATVTVQDAASGCRVAAPGRHVQRHHPPETVQNALRAAGLCCRGVRGQLAGACLEELADDARHAKLVYVAQRARPGVWADRGRG